MLVRGESGTGKELIARAIHEQSAVAGPFVAVNCGAIVPSLIESTLFGHERGAFTSAVQRHEGLFERAHGGTLFLDELGELNAGGQAKLLRVLETGEITPVGATQPKHVRVRVISATHRDLEADVDAGRFRQDLFFRVHVLTADAPPLRAHAGDLDVLADHFLPDGFELTPAALRRLQRYTFPGNVRELRAILERGRLLASPSRRIDAVHITGLRAAATTESRLGTFAEAEAAHLMRVLRAVGGNKARAAEILGVERPTVYAKLKRHGLHEPRGT